MWRAPWMARATAFSRPPARSGLLPLKDAVVAAHLSALGLGDHRAEVDQFVDVTIAIPFHDTSPLQQPRELAAV
jgi:hypothetical protein